MPKGGHRIIRPTRLEAFQFAKFMIEWEFQDRTPPAGLIASVLHRSSEEREKRRITDRDELLRLVLTKISRGITKARQVDAKFPQIMAETIRLDLPIRLIEYASNLIAGPRGGLFGARRIDQSDKWTPYPGAWLFARKCEIAIKVRMGRPRSSMDYISEKIPDPNISERHMYRLLGKQDRHAQHQMFRELIERGMGLLGAEIKLTDFRSA